MKTTRGYETPYVSAKVGTQPKALATYTYDPLSERTSVANGNGTSTSYAFDAASRLTTLAHNLPNDPKDDVSLGFGYTNANQLSSQTVTATNVGYIWTGYTNGQTGITPDGLNRIANIATGGGYDGRENVLTDISGARTFAYDTDNQLTGGDDEREFNQRRARL